MVDFPSVLGVAISVICPPHPRTALILAEYVGVVSVDGRPFVPNSGFLFVGPFHERVPD